MTTYNALSQHVAICNHFCYHWLQCVANSDGTLLVQDACKCFTNLKNDMYRDPFLHIVMRMPFRTRKCDMLRHQALLALQWNDDQRLCKAIHDNLKQYMACVAISANQIQCLVTFWSIYGDVWRCMTICDDVEHITPLDALWVCMLIHGEVWQTMMICRCVPHAYVYIWIGLHLQLYWTSV